MEWNTLFLEKEGNIALLTINRPKALNALNPEVLTELGQAVDVITADDEIFVVILKGAGEKAFVAGADITAMKDMTALESRAFGILGQEVFKKLEYMPKPVIAAINGFALGGGCELAMACDIRVATEKSKFGQPEVGLGVTPGFAGTQRLPRLVGKGRAKELLYTADMISAADAHRIGLVNHVVAEDQLLEFCKSMAKRIATKGQIAVRLCKAAVDQGLEMDVDKSMAFEADIFALCFATSDQKEGMTAFVEKRKPNFIGK
ncbi:short chain enoyl-CoA hydratase [Desulforamulus reducens MI-1]|uniref:short-chain-enoyl-CoA hydratase n=1 Tax=Desulforamulus reducens (strain ATCC BAA-1160 / DSM 100696 / MI-1) TaxID=349161 RepID=A4J1J6_DESRM|nr:short-chain-enoyl-CoA hydratase [Desulforamulus reducens]ABO48949.1 short chain enoyl-CoA hydratase [Desulforamulus reducens MI-1]